MNENLGGKNEIVSNPLMTSLELANSAPLTILGRRRLPFFQVFMKCIPLYTVSRFTVPVYLITSDQVRVVAFSLPQLTQASFIQKIKRCKIIF